MALTGLSDLTATDEQVAQWRAERNLSSATARSITERGECYSCVDQRDGSVFGVQHVVYEDEGLFAALCPDPRSPGHTIVVWREHHADFLQLDDQQTAHLFTVTRRIGAAIERALDEVERVYLVTMSDGPNNHVHLQLIPRHRGHAIGSLRFIDPRGPLLRADEIAGAIREQLAQG